jgi:hypothetical protein
LTCEPGAGKSDFDDLSIAQKKGEYKRGRRFFTVRVAALCAAQRAARIGLLLLGISQEVAKKETKGQAPWHPDRAPRQNEFCLIVARK